MSEPQRVAVNVWVPADPLHECSVCGELVRDGWFRETMRAGDEVHLRFFCQACTERALGKERI